jgi:hypothetical protein
MTTIAQTSVYNVEATLNAWMRAGLTAVTRPSWLTPLPAIVTHVPEAAASLPAFSLTHIPVSMDVDWQGNVVGSTASSKGAANTQIMEVSAWVTRASKQWLAQIRTMQDMVMTVLVNAASVVVKDYAADQDNPADTAYLVRLRDARIAATAPDPNPDIERRRILVTYEWIYRS